MYRWMLTMTFGKYEVSRTIEATTAANALNKFQAEWEDLPKGSENGVVKSVFRA